MKRLIYLFAGILLLSSCSDFLERNPLSEIANENFWNTDTDALAALNGCYSDWFWIDDVIYLDCCSDNSYNPFSWEGYQVQATGLATPNDYGYSYFSFKTIVKCNNFLANIDRPEMDETLRARYKAEARFLRAWRYFLIVTLYGDAPLFTDVLDIDEANLPRNPKSEIIAFIIKELDEASKDLPLSYSGSDAGRVTRGAALALKARMEIFDGQYSACASTCQSIMNLGCYSLVDNYVDVFTEAYERSAEVVLDVEYEESTYNSWVLGVVPPASAGGWSSLNPTQSLVDAYECIDGKTIDESELYDPKEPYKNRDPRLDATIVYPGCWYNGAYLNPIDPADPTGDYYAPYGRSKTGYYPRKYVYQPDIFNDIWATGLNGIVIRYAEVLLTYAEAKIESNSIDESVYSAINTVRLRAGMPEVDRSVYSSQAKLRELIRRERRVELALEGIRWFDICRWKIGEEVMPGPVYGALLGTVDPDTGALGLTDERIYVETRYFDPAKNYLWPIPQSIIDATPAITQNPGY